MTRARTPALALACAALALVVTGCGGGDDDSATTSGPEAAGYVCGGGSADAPTPAAAPAAVDDYVESLAIASDAMRGLPPPPSEFVDASGVTAVVSVDAGAVSDGIRRAISEWQAALQGAAAADLDGTGLADGRAALLAASPVLVQEWTGVAREYAAGGRGSLEGATPATVDAADALCAALDEADAASDGRAADTLDAARTRVEETVDALGAGG